MAARSRQLMAFLIAGVGIALLLILWQGARVPPIPPRDLFPYGELRVGVDASNPPFAVATADDLWGLEIDVARELGRRIDLPVRFVNLGFDGLYDSLKTDQIDALIAGVVIDLTRLNDVHYSQPYFNAGLVIVSSEGVESMTDLPGRRLAYEFGSEADTEARRWLRRVLPFETMPYELPEYALDAARVGDADAALVDAASARTYLREHAQWDADVNQVTDALFAVATQSRRPEISAVIDATLSEMIDDGTLERIIAAWL